MPKLIRITTVPIALKYLLTGQMRMMKESGFDVIMISADGPERDEVIKQEDCPHIIVPMTRKITPFRDLQCLLKLVRIFRKEKPDIVHTHTPKAGLLGMLAAKFAKVPLRIHTVAGLRFITSSGFTRWVLIRMEKWTYRSATHIWPNSFSLLRFLEQNKMAGKKKLNVIGNGSSNGIDLKRFSFEALKPSILEQAKQQMKYDPSLIYFLAVGRIVRDKGVEELLDVFTKLYASHPRLRLAMVGSFEEHLDPLSDDAKKILHDHPGIIHIPWSERVEYFMHLSSALIHASHREGFPNVLLQAGAMKCPVICSGIDGNMDIIEHQKTGLIFEAKNKHELLQQLETAIKEPIILKHYAQNLRQRIEQYFDQRELQLRLKKEYMKLLSSK